MVSYLLGIGLSAPSAVFKRKSSKKVACIDKETDPNSNRREINKSLSHSTEQSTDDLMDGDENNIHKHIVHLIGSMNSDDMIYKPIHHRLERSSSSVVALEVCDKGRCDKVRELIQRRTSSDYTSTRSSIMSRDRRVTFLDEELGLTPRHLVTETYFRPLTSKTEKKMMYYCSRDFILFEREHMYEKIEAEIKAIEQQKRREKDECSDVSVEDDEEMDKKPLDLEGVRKLVQRVRTRLNLNHVMM